MSENTEAENQQEITPDFPETLEEMRPGAPPEGRPGLLAMLAAVLVIWGADIVITVAVVLAAGGSVGNLEQHARMPLNLLIIVSLSSLCTFLIVWYTTSLRYGKSIVRGLALKSVGRETLKKLAFLTAFVALVVGTALAVTGQESGFWMADFLEKPGGLPVIIILALILPLFEEFYYRGLIQPVLARKIGVAAVPLTAAWFTAAHAFQLWNNWLALAIVGVMGLTWTYLRHRYDSLLPSLVSHWCYNTTLVLITLLQLATGLH